MVVISLIVSVLAGIAAGWIVYFALAGGLRAGTRAVEGKTMQSQAESLIDRMGVVCFRIANRVVISTLGGALLVLMLGSGIKRA
ncbi:hypothetical protein [Asticcacaulis solisilvae]|uniref:hypothetical protein n=1 Tax=Asticcacaulis solisilvae TaxID=1217274 RepID=UPI003FD81CEB